MAPGIEEEHVETLSMNGNKIDVINENFAKKYAKNMVKASENWEFFKLVDHGVPSETLENYTSRLHELFDLPVEQKLEGGRTSSFPLGYYASNTEYEKNLPWAEILQLLQSPEIVVQFAKKVYGDKYPTFSTAMIEYMKEMDKLGMTKEATIFRISRFPPFPLQEKIVGIGIHSDPQTLTILYQDLVGGLQILKDEKQWIGVRPLPNSFVINIGDTLEAWTNGRLKSVVHRVVVNKEKQGLSMAYFMNPTSSVTIECPSQLIDPASNPRKYVPCTWAELWHLLLTTRRVRGKAVAINKFLISS
ncbi:unnamed protein product [Withania somnifera]